MVRKTKICKKCKLPKIIWSKGLCKNCAQKTYVYKQKPKKPITKVTDNQKQILREYHKVRKEFLRQKPLCEISLPDCTRKSTQIHHSGKKNSKKLWLDTSLFISCCHNCHEKIENSPDLAKKLGVYNYKV